MTKLSHENLISIIIPVYNQAKSLSKSLESILLQTYPQLEVVVVNDGSREDIHRIIKEKKPFFDKKHIPLRYYYQENKGAPAARNTGFKYSKGKYIIFWDADTIAKPDMLSLMHTKLSSNKKFSYTYSNFFYGKKKMKARPFDKEILKKLNYVHSTSLIKRSDFIVRWDETLKRFQDWDIWLLMAEKGKYGVWIDKYLFQSIINKKGISNWLPKFAYKKPWKYLPGFSKKVKEYEKSKEIIMKKHSIE